MAETKLVVAAPLDVLMVPAVVAPDESKAMSWRAVSTGLRESGPGSVPERSTRTWKETTFVISRLAPCWVAVALVKPGFGGLNARFAATVRSLGLLNCRVPPAVRAIGRKLIWA